MHIISVASAFYSMIFNDCACACFNDRVSMELKVVIIVKNKYRYYSKCRDYTPIIIFIFVIHNLTK